MDAAASAYRKIYRHIVAPLTLLIIMSSIDRVNVSFAAVQMNGDLGLDPRAYGLGVGLFFVGYLLFQLPSAAVLKAIGPRLWIAGSVTGWGLFATMMAFISAPWHFYVLRFLIGMMESGFAPGVVWYVSQWMPQAHRGRAVGMTLLAIPVSVVIGGPLSGALLTLDHGDIPGWRWMFLLEGVATIFLGLIAFWWFVDRPAKARWLTEGEKHLVGEALDAEARAAGPRATGRLADAMRLPALWWSAALWFVLITGANGLIFWLPTAIKSLGTHDDFTVGLLSAMPWAAIGAGMILNARHSDRTQERHRHIGFAAIAGGLGLAGAAMAGGGPLALLFLMVGGLGLGGAQSVFWTVPTRLLGARNPQAITLINLFGNMSGIVAPVAIGWIVATTGRIDIPVYLLALLLLLGAVCVRALRRLDRAASPISMEPVR